MSNEQIMKLVPLLVLLACATQVAALDLVVDGRSDYVIVLAVDAIPAEKFAAEELVLHLEKMSGVKLPIVTDAEPLPRHAILLGRTRFLKELGVEAQWHQFGKEGYLLRVTGDHLIIAGGQPRGVLYGVYALLEDYLGCRWFAPDTSFIPRRKTIELAELIDLDPYLAPDVTGTPAFEYREPWLYTGGRHSLWWRDYFDPKYVTRTRNSGSYLNASVHPIDERHGGRGPLMKGDVALNILQVLADVFEAKVRRFKVANSACLGAALRAYHAEGTANGTGLSWKTVVDGIAVPVTESPIMPKQSSVKTYTRLRRRYAKLEPLAISGCSD